MPTKKRHVLRYFTSPAVSRSATVTARSASIILTPNQAHKVIKPTPKQEQPQTANKQTNKKERTSRSFCSITASAVTTPRRARAVPSSFESPACFANCRDSSMNERASRRRPDRCASRPSCSEATLAFCVSPNDYPQKDERSIAERRNGKEKRTADSSLWRNRNVSASSGRVVRSSATISSSTTATAPSAIRLAKLPRKFGVAGEL